MSVSTLRLGYLSTIELDTVNNDGAFDPTALKSYISFEESNLR